MQKKEIVENINKPDYLKRNLAIGFGIGFLLGIWMGRSATGDIGLVGILGVSFIFGLGGAFLGWIETIAQRKKQKDSKFGENLTKWWILIVVIAILIIILVLIFGIMML